MSIGSDITALPRPKKAASSNTAQQGQFLRFVAVGMALIAHGSVFIHHRVDPDVHILGDFAQGVVLFFVISGFIMAITAGPYV